MALKSMIGSTAQQFLTFLSHRGEETGNIRGSMKVRVPTERLGTRERLYGGVPIGRDMGHKMGWARLGGVDQGCGQDLLEPLEYLEVTQPWLEVGLH